MDNRDAIKKKEREKKSSMITVLKAKRAYKK